MSNTEIILSKYNTQRNILFQYLVDLKILKKSEKNKYSPENFNILNKQEIIENSVKYYLFFPILSQVLIENYKPNKDDFGKKKDKFIKTIKINEKYENYSRFGSFSISDFHKVALSVEQYMIVYDYLKNNNKICLILYSTVLHSGFIKIVLDYSVTDVKIYSFPNNKVVATIGLQKFLEDIVSKKDFDENIKQILFNSNDIPNNICSMICVYFSKNLQNVNLIEFVFGLLFVIKNDFEFPEDYFKELKKAKNKKRQEEKKQKYKESEIDISILQSQQSQQDKETEDENENKTEDEDKDKEEKEEDQIDDDKNTHEEEGPPLDEKKDENNNNIIDLSKDEKNDQEKNDQIAEMNFRFPKRRKKRVAAVKKDEKKDEKMEALKTLNNENIKYQSEIDEYFGKIEQIKKKIRLNNQQIKKLL